MACAKARRAASDRDSTECNPGIWAPADWKEVALGYYVVAILCGFLQLNGEFYQPRTAICLTGTVYAQQMRYRRKREQCLYSRVLPTNQGARS